MFHLNSHAQTRTLTANDRVMRHHRAEIVTRLFVFSGVMGTVALGSVQVAAYSGVSLFYLVALASFLWVVSVVMDSLDVLFSIQADLHSTDFKTTTGRIRHGEPHLADFITAQHRLMVDDTALHLPRGQEIHANSLVTVTYAPHSGIVLNIVSG